MNETGSLTILALVVLATLTILGASISSITNTELGIAKNEASGKNAFYMAEGGLQREARELGKGNYSVDSIHSPQHVATQTTARLPPPIPHTVMGERYDFTVDYLGCFLPRKGFSATEFTRYDFTVQVCRKSITIKARYGRIGPKAK